MPKTCNPWNNRRLTANCISAIKMKKQTMTCSNCNVEKPLNKENFPPRTKSQKFSYICNVCQTGLERENEDLKTLSKPRKCKKCETTKTLNEFEKCHTNNYKRGYICKICYNEKQRKRRKKNRTSILQQRKIEKSNMWKNKPIRARAERMETTVRIARNSGLAVDRQFLDLDFIENLLIENPNCLCCGVPFDYVPKKVQSLNIPTFDKVEPPKGYVSGNVEVICWQCNFLKKNATIEELSIIIRYMLSNGLKI